MSNRLGGFIAGQNINVSIGTFTALATPDLTFASTAATPAVGQPLQFTTTGTLPTGLSTNTTYYVRSVNSNTCQVSTTQGGSATTYTNGTGSGTHTAVTQRAFNPYAGAPDTVEYLVVAGGGGGGNAFQGANGGGGGGGAGGVLAAANFSVASGTALTVTVGAGGSGAAVPAASGNLANGTAGSNSVFSSITATGGGYGAGIVGAAGGSGGSGGGGCQGGAGGAGTSGQGFAGSGSSAGSPYTPGSGGGAGSVGVYNGYGSAAGTGIVTSITGTQVLIGGGGCGGAYGFTPVSYAPAGGGNGGDSTVNGLGQSTGFAGTAGTGGGGGGGTSGSSRTGGGGNGGSRIVIVRYPLNNAAPAMVTGSPQVSYANGYQIYTWTSSGSIIF
jgi:hypothetical protein